MHRPAVDTDHSYLCPRHCHRRARFSSLVVVCAPSAWAKPHPTTWTSNSPANDVPARVAVAAVNAFALVSVEDDDRNIYRLPHHHQHHCHHCRHTRRRAANCANYCSLATNQSCNVDFCFCFEHIARLVICHVGVVGRWMSVKSLHFRYIRKLARKSHMK